MTRRFMFSEFILGFLLGKPQLALATSWKCICGSRPFEFGTQKILTCTKCGLMFMEKFKQTDPTPG